ncbi:CRAL-TRIO domain-containing protein [Catenaria anguillulae PL171]|uniref:CRAL-TRIO domain-containing protein n=1 Tax=Catenaria anguillulae PL171 TaxID=765915 RepID=A0A1Y2HRM7_9FUNG|nr:CRAL-TRIO domain-containing protein [Catenaria anguillulae PL171]
MAAFVTTPSLSHKRILECDQGDTDRSALAQVKLDLDLLPTLTPPDRAWANDACILRYLRAHNSDPRAALSGLMATLDWRNATAPHRIPLSRIRSEGVSGKLVTHGFSRTGMPVLYMVPRNENSTNEDLQLAYTLWTLEVCIRRMPPGVEKLVLVIDFAGMSLANSVSPSMQRKFVSVLTAHYPERLSRAYLVNAPWFFGAVWKAISPFLDPVTKPRLSLSKQRASQARTRCKDPTARRHAVGIAFRVRGRVTNR